MFVLAYQGDWTVMSRRPCMPHMTDTIPLILDHRSSGLVKAHLIHGPIIYKMHKQTGLKDLANLDLILITSHLMHFLWNRSLS